MDDLDPDDYVSMPMESIPYVMIPKAQYETEQAKNAQLRAALLLCANTLEGHLDEPQAVTHAECRMAARQARAALDGGKG